MRDRNTASKWEPKALECVLRSGTLKSVRDSVAPKRRGLASRCMPVQGIFARLGAAALRELLFRRLVAGTAVLMLLLQPALYACRKGCDQSGCCSKSCCRSTSQNPGSASRAAGPATRTCCKDEGTCTLKNACGNGSLPVDLPALSKSMLESGPTIPQPECRLLVSLSGDGPELPGYFAILLPPPLG